MTAANKQQRALCAREKGAKTKQLFQENFPCTKQAKTNASKLSHLKLQLANGQIAQLPKRKILNKITTTAIKFCINDEINDSKAKQLWQIEKRKRAEARGERPLFLLGCSYRRWRLSALCLFVG